MALSTGTGVSAPDQAREATILAVAFPLSATGREPGIADPGRQDLLESQERIFQSRLEYGLDTNS